MSFDNVQPHPRVTATIGADGGVEVIFDGVPHYLRSATLPAARQELVAYVMQRVREVVGRAVLVQVTEPDGRFELAVHPDGNVAERANREPEPAASAADPHLEATVMTRARPTAAPAPEPPAPAQPVAAPPASAQPTPAQPAADHWAPQPAVVDQAPPEQQPAGPQYPVAGPAASPAQQHPVPTPAPFAAPDRPPSAMSAFVPTPGPQPAGAAYPAEPAGAAYPPQPGEPALTRRQLRESFLSQDQVEAPATSGLRGILARAGIKTAPSAAERSERTDRNAVSQHWPGVRTIAVVNGKGGANKTPTTALLAAVFARNSGAATLAWDNNVTRGTLGWRTDQGHHDSTVLDLLPEVDNLLSPGAKAGDISHFVHHQPADKYDVLRSNPNLLSSETRISAADVDSIHDVAGRYYRLVFVDSGNDESAENWLRMIDKADQLVVASIAKPEHAEAGALLLEELVARGGRAADLARGAVVVVSQAREKDSKPSAVDIAQGFTGWVRDTVTIPYDRAMVESVLRFDALAPATQRAWLRAGAAVAAGL